MHFLKKPNSIFGRFSHMLSLLLNYFVLSKANKVSKNEIIKIKHKII